MVLLFRGFYWAALMLLFYWAALMLRLEGIF